MSESSRKSRTIPAAVAVLACLLVQPSTSGEPAQTPAAPRPNIVMFLVDDMGTGDLSVTGHPTIKTPNLDQMAREGIRLTSFYSAPVCTPAPPTTGCP